MWSLLFKFFKNIEKIEFIKEKHTGKSNISIFYPFKYIYYVEVFINELYLYTLLIVLWFFQASSIELIVLLFLKVLKMSTM